MAIKKQSEATDKIFLQFGLIWQNAPLQAVHPAETKNIFLLSSEKNVVPSLLYCGESDMSINTYTYIYVRIDLACACKQQQS